jgi:nickel-dependent lactate racemase
LTAVSGGLADMRTGAWYDERSWDLAVPEDWRVTVHWPRTPPPLDDDQVAEAIAAPIGQPSLAEAARGARRPVVLVDDLTRPTPANRVLPFLLDEFRSAGIRASDVTILMGTGTHASTGLDAIRRKVGAEVAEACRLAVHDDRGDLARVGRTSFGTAIQVNPLIAESDFVCGIGGVYPQHAVGFGGGSKLVLGALGRQTIAALHYRHRSMDGRYDVENDFRRELDEMAGAVGLDFLVTTHVDAGRNLVRLVCGDWRAFYPDEVAFARQAYAAPAPCDADVVISNSYPIDVSLTFMRSKGIIPLLQATPGASRILLSACAEGVGRHGLFPLERTRSERVHHVARTLWYKRREVPAKVARRVKSKVEARGAEAAGRRRPAPIRLVLSAQQGLPAVASGFTVSRSWSQAVDEVRAEQPAGDLDVVVYPCAPLQVIGDAGE